jgi:autotransporter-associated beta strand protein
MGLFFGDDIDFDQDFSGIYSGVISDAAQTGGDGGTTPEQGTLIKDDSADSNAANSNVTLTAVQAYSGVTYIEAGTLTLDATNAIADSTGVTLGRVGGAVDGQTATLALEANNTLQSLSNDASNTTSVVLNGYTLTLTPASGTDSVFTGTIVDGSTSGGSIVVDDTGTPQSPGTVTLGGDDSFTGGVSIEAGTLELANANAAGSGAITFDAASQAMLKIDLGDLPTNSINGFAIGDTIDLAGVGLETNFSYSGGVLLLTGGLQGRRPAPSCRWRCWRHRGRSWRRHRSSRW